MDPIRVSAASLFVALLSTTLPACGNEASTGSEEPSGVSTSSSSPSTRHSPRSPSVAPTGQPEEPTMRISLTIGDQQFRATLDDSVASRDLLAQLPQTVEMSDHGGVERTGRLRSPLSLEGQPDGADPAVGDVGYYAPGQDLVLYYGDQSYFPGIVILGRLEGDAARRLADLGGAVAATVEAG